MTTFRDRYYSLYFSAHARLRSRLSLWGVTDDNTIDEFLDDAADYAEPRPQFWAEKTDEYLTNLLVWKAERLCWDHKRHEPLSIDSLLEDDNSEDEILSWLFQNSEVDEGLRGSQEQLCEKNLLLEAVFQAMTPTSRRCCQLLAKGYTRAAIAQELGMKYDAVARAIQRGIAAARKKLVKE